VGFRMNIHLRIRRGVGRGPSRWQEYSLDISSEAYVLDAIEAAGWQDPTLVFRHACHHASCGSCAVRIQGRERLPCIVRVREASRSGGIIQLEPLRNFPREADLVVDRSTMMDALRAAGMPQLRVVESAGLTEESDALLRFENCIECGICVSACPIAGSDAGYLGPAALAAAERVLAGACIEKEPKVRDWVDTRHGVWRCHGIFACSEACPADVDPAAAVMRIRSSLRR
jgi:succinate dehydrogenase / fumarate reductase, iron-sulfur subunit